MPATSTSMKIALVTAPIATDFEDAGDVASLQGGAFKAPPQLGVLTLAAVLEHIGVLPELVNLDRWYYQYLEQFGSRGLQDFPVWIAPEIIASDSDIYGFGSICSSYPLTIRIAERIKRLKPSATILFGGPQASAVDLPTLAAFPFVDFILRGEAEQTLPRFLEEWSGRRDFGAVAGLSWRSPFGPVRNADAPLIEDLDCLPIPAYHLTDDLADAPYAPLELGRGCPFSCTFCSTNDFFRRRFRIKSPARMLSEMQTIRDAYGLTSFDLTHDMFTVDRKRVVAFCRHLIESGEKFAWSCSARTDCVDEELIELMAAAGCDSMFFGVESGSRRLQRIIDKDLDPDRAKVMVTCAERFGIETTVSLITGFPEENMDDVRDTAAVYMHAMRHPGALPQLNLLAPLAGTPLYSRYKDQLVLEELSSEMSHQGRIQNEADRALIRQYPHVFPNFYLVPAPGLDRAWCMEFREFLRYGGVRLRWLFVAIDAAAGGIVDVFSAWRERREWLHPELFGGAMRYYYMHRNFADEFVGFIRELPLAESFAVEALVRSHCALMEQEHCDRGLPRQHPAAGGHRRATDVPVRSSDMHVLELDFDIQRVVDSLKRGTPAERHSTQMFYRTGRTNEGTLRLIAITPLMARGLQMCEGSRTSQQFVEQMADRLEGEAQFRRKTAQRLLQAMHAKGFIEFRRPVRQLARSRFDARRAIPII